MRAEKIIFPKKIKENRYRIYYCLKNICTRINTLLDKKFKNTNDERNTKIKKLHKEGKYHYLV